MEKVKKEGSSEKKKEYEEKKEYKGKQKKEYKGKLPDPVAPNVKFSLKSR